jgi:hypothetical protein
LGYAPPSAAGTDQSAIKVPVKITALRVRKSKRLPGIEAMRRKEGDAPRLELFQVSAMRRYKNNTMLRIFYATPVNRKCFLLCSLRPV